MIKDKFIKVLSDGATDEWEEMAIGINSISIIEREDSFDNESNAFWLTLVCGERILAKSDEIKNMFEIKGSDHE